MDIVAEVKRKKEFSLLPDSIIERSIACQDTNLDLKTLVKEVRSDLRKYFGVFLTNKVMKPKNLLDYEAVLKSHKSSHLRDYNSFYASIKDVLGDDFVFPTQKSAKADSHPGGRSQSGRLFSETKSKKVLTASVVDIGCGMNGFSYPYLQEIFGNVSYVGLEASGQVVTVTNDFFLKRGYENCTCVHEDIFDLDVIRSLVQKEKRPVMVFLFQVVDALEHAKKDFSKELLLQLKSEVAFIVVSNPIKSLSGKKVFESKRDWLTEFLQSNFEVLGDFVMNNERVFVLKC